MKFKYSARTQEGELQVGFVEAGSRDAAAGILTGHNLYILNLTSAGGEHWYDRIGQFFGGVKRKDLVIFTRQLATLLEARLPLNEALKTLIEQTSNAALREGIFQIAQDIDTGLSFSQALDRQRTIFSEFFISMVRSAEVTGNLAEISGFLADYFEKESLLVGKARSALIYPALVVSLFIVVAGIMVTVVFPQIGPVFEESGVELPAFTRFLIGSGSFITQWWLPLFVLLIFLLGAVINYVRTEEGKALWDDIKLRAPIFRKIFVPIALARLANASAILIKGGVPISQALEIVSHTIDNALYSDLLHGAAESVRSGEPLSKALAQYPRYFPSLVTQMIAVGEATGQIDVLFTRLATFYNRESDTVINNIVDLIQPALMIGLGLLVGILFSSILLPIYQLTSKF